jgi:hypothetical protein
MKYQLQNYKYDHVTMYIFKVIDDSLNILMCFVVPKTRCIYMSDFYLRLVRDDAQVDSTIRQMISQFSHGRMTVAMDSLKYH